MRRQMWYTVCADTVKGSLDIEEIISAIRELEPEELKPIKAEVDRRLRDARKGPGQTKSVILKYLPYQDGHFTLEERVYKKTGRTRGPYWYFHFHEGGRQRKVYLGKTDNPEFALEHKRHTQSRSAGGIALRRQQPTEKRDAREDKQTRRAPG